MRNAFWSALDWIEKNILWLMLLAVGATTGAALLRNKSSAVNNARSALASQRLKDQLEGLRAKARKISAIDRDKANEALKLADAITQKKKAIAEVYSGKPWAEMADDEIERALRDAGV